MQRCFAMERMDRLTAIGKRLYLEMFFQLIVLDGFTFKHESYVKC